MLQVFKPPNPWSMALMNVLAELHQEPDLKLNLKFEIEVLCKNLNLDVNVSKPVRAIICNITMVYNATRLFLKLCIYFPLRSLSYDQYNTPALTCVYNLLCVSRI